MKLKTMKKSFNQKKLKNIKLILLIIFSFLLGVSVTYQFPRILDLPKVYIAGIKHILLDKKIEKPAISDDKYKHDEKIFANYFNITVNSVDYLSTKITTKTDSSNKINYQHFSSGLYAKKVNGKTELRLFTRDGHEINKNAIIKYKLPKTYDSHNSAGGLRGIFFYEDKPYGLMAAKDIGCQYASIVNLKTSKEIFKTDCIPDYKSIHYNAIGGANTHFENNILVSIGVPTNSSQKIRDLAQNKKSFFGKIISIDKKDLDKNKILKPNIFSLGHRNPQGLAKIGDKIFSSEHGPRGGDEINLIKQYGNYGWPIVSYGTKYEFNGKIKAYKFNHYKLGFIDPIYQFTPSIAVSSLAECTKQLKKFYETEGCLLATSLKSKSLFILLLNNKLDRVIGFEKILLKERLRHFANDLYGNLYSEDDGSIYISSDVGLVLKVTFNLKKE